MSSISFDVPSEFQRWAATFDNLPEALDGQSELWTLAGEVFFANTQQATHVITGDLRASGQLHTGVGADGPEATVTYGNSTVDYAEYERARGGSHDFLQVAFERSEATWSAALESMWAGVWS